MEKLINQLTWHNLIGKLKVILKELSKSAGSEVVVESISDASEIGKSVLKGANAQAVRSLIGAGTSNLALGSTSTTAKKGDYVPAWGEVTEKPTTFAPIIGTTATTAKAGNYTPPDVTTTANGLMLATDKVKLNAIQAEATKNQTDAFLLSRANHTGTQAISTVTGVVPIAQIPTGTTATTVKLGNYTPSATEIVTAINAMTPEQVTTVQTKLGIVPTP